MVAHKVALIAPGQGSQRPGGIVDLPLVAKPWFDRASDLIGIDLWQAGLDSDQEQLGRPSSLQPFLVAWGMADVHAARGTIPEASEADFVLGHSSGQNTALVLSGALDYDDAIRFAHERGKHLDLGCDAEPGALLALAGVDQPLAEEMAVANGLQIANYNAPNQFVLGGPRDAAEAALGWAASREIAAVLLRVNGAFHTQLFKRSDELSQALIEALPVRDGFTPLIGNARGQLIQAPTELRAELLGQYSRPIHWVSALRTAYEEGVRRFAVMGPGNAMAGLVRRFATEVDERPKIVRLNQSR